MLELNTLKSENINWIEVVLDYGKRFPDATFRDVGLGKLYKFSNLRFATNFRMKDNYLCTDSNWYVVRNEFGLVEYYDTVNWLPVPQHILLRLLTEGEEDLI